MDRTNRRGKHIYRRHCPKATSTAGPDTDWGMLMTRHGRVKKNRVVEDHKWRSPTRTAVRAEEVEKAGLKKQKAHEKVGADGPQKQDHCDEPKKIPKSSKEFSKNMNKSWPFNQTLVSSSQ